MSDIFEHAKLLTMPKLLTTLLLAVSLTGFSAPEHSDDALNKALATKLSLQQRAPGQPLKIFNGVSFGGGLGASWFMGDLADHKVMPKPADWSTTLGYNWSLYLRKEFKYGIGAKLQFDKGDLQGGRVIGDASPRVDFETEYTSLHLQLSFNLLEPIFDGRAKKRYYLNAEIGAGLTFYRSLTFWGEGPPLVRDFEGYSTQDEPATQRYSTMERASMTQTINIPIGLTFGYMLNHRVDVTAQVMLNNVMTDRLETWARDRSSRDKFAYTTIGIRYNFNRTEKDFPDRRKRKNTRSRASVSPNELDLGDKLKPVKGFKGSSKREKEMLEAMMRMYELQLQLFQLQYLAK